MYVRFTEQAETGGERQGQRRPRLPEAPAAAFSELVSVVNPVDLADAQEAMHFAAEHRLVIVSTARALGHCNSPAA